MFIFRSRRSSLVKRLWRLQPGDENNGERRAVATAVLKRLKEPALEGLVRALEGSGKDSGVCCLVPKGGLRLGRLGTVSPQVLTAQLFRWPDVQEEEQLVQVKPLCENQDQDLFVCCNPWHWARALPIGGNHFCLIQTFSAQPNQRKTLSFLFKWSHLSTQSQKLLILTNSEKFEKKTRSTKNT